MSTDLLEAVKTKNVQHIPLYDLQSFFYVFVWMCIIFRGPGQPRNDTRPLH